jgi:putative lipase involved disintegration of autophagic bodies
MTENTAVANRHALALFNFMSKKQKNDKRIGELTLGDFVEMCELINMKEYQTFSYHDSKVRAKVILEDDIIVRLVIQTVHNSLNTIQTNYTFHRTNDNIPGMFKTIAQVNATESQSFTNWIINEVLPAFSHRIADCTIDNDKHE